MAKQGNWNKSFWKRFEESHNIPVDNIRQIMLEEVGKTEAVLNENTPVRYGGLKASVYGVVADTDNGISARVGYTQTPHWDLDPTNPHQDTFTNPTLMEYLEAGTVEPETNAKIARVKQELSSFQDRVRERVYNELKRR